MSMKNIINLGSVSSSGVENGCSDWGGELFNTAKAKSMLVFIMVNGR